MIPWWLRYYDKINISTDGHVVLWVKVLLKVHLIVEHGDDHVLSVSPHWNLESLKFNISQGTEVEKEKQNLFFDGKKMSENERTLAQYGVSNGSTIKLEGQLNLNVYIYHVAPIFVLDN